MMELAMTLDGMQRYQNWLNKVVQSYSIYTSA